MKILFVTNGYPTVNNPEYCVFTKEQIESVSKFQEIEGQLIFINARENGIQAYIKAIPILKKKIRQADLIHTFHGLTFLLVFLIAPSKQIVVSFLNSIENEYGEKKFLSQPLVFLTKRLIQRMNITKIFKDKVPARFSQNSYYLPNGVDTSKFYPISKSEAKRKLGLDESKKYILFVSSKNKYRKQKRYDRYKKVLEILRMRYDNIEELALVNEPRERIIYYFNAAELHLLTSDFEGSPNSVKEALACNIPVVATNSGNVKMMLDGIENCYVSSSFNASELADLTTKVLEVPSSEVNISKYITLKRLDMKAKALELTKIYKEAFFR